MSRYFVGVGSQQAGTIWLRDQLARHPQLALPKRGELHYFDSVYPVRQGPGFGAQYMRSLRRAIEKGNKAQAMRVLASLEMVHRGPDAYRETLAATATDTTRKMGEITPAYANLTRRGFVAMRHTLRSPKVLLTLRDPIDRHWSAVRAAVPDQAEATFASGPFDKVAQGRGDYRTVVTLLDDVFGDAVLYLFFEDLFTEQTLRRVARHLGVRPKWDWALEPPASTAAPVPDIPDGLAEALADQYAFVRERFGADVPDSWREIGAVQA